VFYRTCVVGFGGIFHHSKYARTKVGNLGRRSAPHCH
jgi:hypothetical protein